MAVRSPLAAAWVAVSHLCLPPTLTSPFAMPWAPCCRQPCHAVLHSDTSGNEKSTRSTLGKRHWRTSRYDGRSASQQPPPPVAPALRREGGSRRQAHGVRCEARVVPARTGGTLSLRRCGQN